jgi:hypothetical protein
VDYDVATARKSLAAKAVEIRKNFEENYEQLRCILTGETYVV